jgi:hypothetical protein
MSFQLNCNGSNGRVNILGPNMEDRFSMSDRIPINSTKYTFRDSMTGNWYDTKLSTAFFSNDNMQIIQNGIRSGVYHKSNRQYVIGEQNPYELQIIMRSIFLQYAKNLTDNIPQQINDLNKNVFDYAINQVYGEADGYMKYKRDASTMWTPMEMPVLSYSNDKQLELKKWF